MAIGDWLNKKIEGFSEQYGFSRTLSLRMRNTQAFKTWERINIYHTMYSNIQKQ
jgi:hypothetical protein